jgi:signal peptidase
VLIVSILLLTFISFSPLKSFQLLRVMSGSMEPAIKTGAIVLVKQTPLNLIVKGDVINFETSGTSVTHRVYEIKNTDNKLTFITKGDANNIPDVDSVSPAQIKGKVIFNIPYLGYVYNWIKQPIGFLILIILPALFVIISELINIKRLIEAEAVRKYELSQKSVKNKKSKKEEDVTKTMPILFLLLILGSALAFSHITGTSSYFSAGKVLANNTFSTNCWAAPSVPVLTYPGDNTSADSTWLNNPVMEWNSSTSDCPSAGQIVYQYESYYDPGLTQLAYSSGWLVNTNIPAQGTPDNTYYWHVRAKDSNGLTSEYSAPFKFTVDRSILTPTPTPTPTPAPGSGCTDPSAINYDSTATQENHTCSYCPIGQFYDRSMQMCETPTPPPTVVLGCTDPSAINYNHLATQENNTCTYCESGQFYDRSMQMCETPTPTPTPTETPTPTP